MRIHDCKDRTELNAALAVSEAGDCVRIEGFSAVAANVGDMLSALAAIDERGADLIVLDPPIDSRDTGRETLFSHVRALCALDGGSASPRRRDGIERAREEGRYRGRKPIALDEGLFESVVQLWQNGDITARQAMARLNLKPNTFYRRIKEREEQNMKDYKKAEREIKAELKEAARQSRQDLDALKKQVRSEAKELKRATDEKLELHDVEREIRRERQQAEAEYQDAVRQMKKEVEAESRELKKLMEES